MFKYVRTITNKNDWEKATLEVLSKHYTDAALLGRIQRAKIGKKKEIAVKLENALFGKWFDNHFWPADAMENVFKVKIETIKSKPYTDGIWSAYSKYFYERRPDLKVF